MFQDFMIPVERAVPKNGTEVMIRLEDTHTLTYATFKNGKFVGLEVNQPVVSWVPTGSKCECESLRWQQTNKKGRCKSCGISWR